MDSSATRERGIMEDCSGAALFAAHDRMRETFTRTGSAAAAHAAELARYDDDDTPDDDDEGMEQ